MRWTVPQKPELSGMSLLRETTKQRCEPPCPGRKLLSPSRKIDYVQGRPHDETGIVVRLYRDGDVIREDQGRVQCCHQAGIRILIEVPRSSPSPLTVLRSQLGRVLVCCMARCI